MGEWSQGPDDRRLLECGRSDPSGLRPQVSMLMFFHMFFHMQGARRRCTGRSLPLQAPGTRPRVYRVRNSSSRPVLCRGCPLYAHSPVRPFFRLPVRPIAAERIGLEYLSTQPGPGESQCMKLKGPRPSGGFFPSSLLPFLCPRLPHPHPHPHIPPIHPFTPARCGASQTEP